VQTYPVVINSHLTML